MSNLYRVWVLTLCHKFGFIFLTDLPWCSISTGCECWLCAMKSVLFCWVTFNLMCNLYRKWVLTWCHESIYFVKNVCFSVLSLQLVSVIFLCFILLSDLYRCLLGFSDILPSFHLCCVIRAVLWCFAHFHEYFWLLAWPFWFSLWVSHPI